MNLRWNKFKLHPSIDFGIESVWFKAYILKIFNYKGFLVFLDGNNMDCFLEA